MRIGILGGTFNPIHIGHLIMAESARETFGLSKILFIPCAIPPHKKASDLAAPKLRLQMLERALAGNPNFSACDMEIVRGGKSYSYDTLKELRAAHGPKDRFFFIIGADSLEQILSWHRIRELMKLCRFIVVERPQDEAKPAREILRKMSRADRRYFGEYILNAFPIGVSSRQIRERLRRGLSVRYLVPEAVEVFLARTGLYQKGR